MDELPQQKPAKKYADLTLDEQTGDPVRTEEG
jgi:hypothetical protein